jgi:hypothetical protein
MQQSRRSIRSIAQFQYNYGVSGDVGVRFRVANRVALRVDGVADYMKDTKNLNLIGRAGLSLLIGGGRREVMCTYAGSRTFLLRAAVRTACSASGTACTSCNVPVPGSWQPDSGRSGLRSTGRNSRSRYHQDHRPIYFDFDKSTIRPDAGSNA